MPTRETSPHGRPPELAVPERNWRQKSHHTVNFIKADKAMPPSPPASPYMSLGETTNRTDLEPTPKTQDLLKKATDARAHQATVATASAQGARP